MKGVCPWIIRHVIDFAFKKFSETQAKLITTPVVEEDGYGVVETTSTKTPGRPAGTTDAGKLKHKYQVAKAHDAAAIEYHDVKMIACKKGKNVETQK